MEEENTDSRERRLNGLLLLGGFAQIIALLVLGVTWLADMTRWGLAAGGAVALLGLSAVLYALVNLHFTIRSLEDARLWNLFTTGVVLLIVLPVVAITGALGIFWWGFAVAFIWAVAASLTVITYAMKYRWSLDPELRYETATAFLDKNQQRQLSLIGAWVATVSLAVWWVLLIAGWNGGLMFFAVIVLVAGVLTYVSYFGVLAYYVTPKERDKWKSSTHISGIVTGIGLGTMVGAAGHMFLAVLSTVAAMVCFVSVTRRQHTAMRT